MRRTPLSAGPRRLAGPSFAIILGLTMVGACTTSAAPASATPASFEPAAATSSAPASSPAASSAPSAVPTTAASAPASAVTCAVVSSTDLQSLAGASSVKLVRESEPAPGLAVCEWQINPNGVGAVNIATGPMAEAVSAATWAQFGSKPAVSGVGDEAHWDGTAQTLEVKFGTSYASFALFGPTVSDPKASAISLAKLVLPKLGG